EGQDRQCAPFARHRGRFLRCACGLFWELLTRMPIDQRMDTCDRSGKRYSPGHVALFGEAVRSDFRILLAVACPGSERIDRMNPCRHPDAHPWSRSAYET